MSQLLVSEGPVAQRKQMELQRGWKLHHSCAILCDGDFYWPIIIMLWPSEGKKLASLFSLFLWLTCCLVLTDSTMHRYLSHIMGLSITCTLVQYGLGT